MYIILILEESTFTIPKKYSTLMLHEDFITFRNEVASGKASEQNFIRNFITNHRDEGIRQPDDVYSFFLKRAIEIKDKGFVLHILQHDHTSNILINLNRNDMSPLYETLVCDNEDLQEIIFQYIRKNRDLPKSRITSELNLLVGTLRTSGKVFSYLIKFIEPLYSEEVRESIVELLGGEDNIYDLTY